jgi:hypothetical protein
LLFRGEQKMRRPARRARIRPLLAAAALLGLALASRAADAQAFRRQRYYEEHVQVYFVPSGLYVGAGFIASHVLDQSGGPRLLEDGAGLTLYGGLRLSQRLALELGWLSTFHSPENVDTFYFGSDPDYLVLTGFTGDAKIYLGPGGRRTELYVQGGVGLYLLDSKYFGSQSVGTGFQAGGGIDVHMGPHLDLGIRALYRGIAMGPPRSDQDDTYVSALSGEANLSVRF